MTHQWQVPAKRKEIPKSVKREVFVRAGGPEDVTCEGCGLNLGHKRFDYDHEYPEWLKDVPPRERPPITADDVKLLGVECCHKKKTAKEAGQRAHGNRLIDNQVGAKPRKGRPIPGSRDSGWKHKMDGTWERRT